MCPGGPPGEAGPGGGMSPSGCGGSESPTPRIMACVEIKFHGAFVLNRCVVFHTIDATPARWRGDAGSSPLDRARTAASSPRNDLVKNCRVHPTHWLISTQVTGIAFCEMLLLPIATVWKMCEG